MITVQFKYKQLIKVYMLSRLSSLQGSAFWQPLSDMDPHHSRSLWVSFILLSRKNRTCKTLNQTHFWVFVFCSCLCEVGPIYSATHLVMLLQLISDRSVVSTIQSWSYEWDLSEVQYSCEFLSADKTLKNPINAVVVEAFIFFIGICVFVILLFVEDTFGVILLEWQGGKLCAHFLLIMPICKT